VNQPESKLFRGNQPQKTGFQVCPGCRRSNKRQIKMDGWIEKGQFGKKRKIVLSRPGQKQLMQK
jgi:hypothetical protein